MRTRERSGPTRLLGYTIYRATHTHTFPFVGACVLHRPSFVVSRTEGEREIQTNTSPALRTLPQVASSLGLWPWGRVPRFEGPAPLSLSISQSLIRLPAPPGPRAPALSRCPPRRRVLSLAPRKGKIEVSFLPRLRGPARPSACTADAAACCWRRRPRPVRPLPAGAALLPPPRPPPRPLPPRPGCARPFVPFALCWLLDSLDSRILRAGMAARASALSPAWAAAARPALVLARANDRNGSVAFVAPAPPPPPAPDASTSEPPSAEGAVPFMLPP